MLSTSLLAPLLLGLAATPIQCLPRPQHQDDAHSIHAKRELQVEMEGWEIGLVIICLVFGLIALGALGGACETVICMKFKRPDPHKVDDLDFGCQGSSSSSIPEIKIIDNEKLPENRVFAHHDEDPGIGKELGLERSGSGRYSWQDGQGVKTEMYLDGALPDARPTERVVVSTQAQGYPVQAAMRGYEGVHYQGRAAGLASNPPFVVHDEGDDSEYESDRPRDSEDSVDCHGPAEAVSTDEVVSPLTPEPLNVPAWPQRSRAAGQTADEFSDVEIDREEDSHGSRYRYL